VLPLDHCKSLPFVSPDLDDGDCHNHRVFACEQSLCRRVVQCGCCWTGHGDVSHSSSRVSTKSVRMSRLCIIKPHILSCYYPTVRALKQYHVTVCVADTDKSVPIVFSVDKFFLSVVSVTFN